MRLLLSLLPALFILTGCDQIGGMLGLPDPAKAEADGKAIGAACRNSGRGLEDCYTLNTRASKAAVYAGWKEMNEYMIAKGMEASPPEVESKGASSSKKKKTGESAHESPTEGDKATDGPEGKGKDKDAQDTAKPKDEKATAKPGAGH